MSTDSRGVISGSLMVLRSRGVVVCMPIYLLELLLVRLDVSGQLDSINALGQLDREIRCQLHRAENYFSA